jgi:hypothetical protein
VPVSRKNVYNYVILNGVDASISFDTFSSPTTINFLDNAGIQIFWTGNPVGEFKVFVSNDKLQGNELPTNWSELDFGTSILIDSSNSDILINMNQLPFSYLAVSYEAASGSGVITANLTTKMVGG